jgi:hypothetical protein
MTDINFKRVSPSGVGAYASCPLKLVLDSQFPDGPNQYQSQMDFGTVGHYMTFVALGCANAVPEPAPALVLSALECWKPPRGTENTLANYVAYMRKLGEKVAAIIGRLTPLPQGVVWVAEQLVADKTLLPSRRGRHGEDGYGGSIDIFMSDNSVLWDFKFTNGDYIADVGDFLSEEYTWQLGSYAFLKGIRQSNLVYMARDGSKSRVVRIDWTTERAKKYLAHMRRFIEFTGHANYASIAWPVRGHQCTFCRHRERRCPAFGIGLIEDPDSIVVKAPGEDPAAALKAFLAGKPVAPLPGPAPASAAVDALTQFAAPRPPVPPAPPAAPPQLPPPPPPPPSAPSVASFVELF